MEKERTGNSYTHKKTKKTKNLNIYILEFGINKKEDLVAEMQRLQALHLEDQARHIERLKVIQADSNSRLHSATTFEELNLPEQLMTGIHTMKFNSPSMIQAHALPLMLADPPTNLIAQAESGSGKTAAFVLGMLARIDPAVKEPQAICLSPTRELAVQTHALCMAPMSQHMAGVTSCLAVPGDAFFIPRGQTCTAQLVVGTPGKLEDWLRKRIIKNPGKIKVFVLDEADNMLAKEGHEQKTIAIKKKIPNDCQRLLFSATYTPEVWAFAEKFAGNNCNKIRIESDDELVLSEIKQFWIDTSQHENGSLGMLVDIYDIMTVRSRVLFACLLIYFLSLYCFAGRVFL